MRLLTYRDGARTRLGVLRDGMVEPRDAPDAAAAIGGSLPPAAGDPVPLEGLEVLPPHRPGTLIGVGLNYRDHAAETGRPAPEEPLLFAKLRSSVTGPSGPVRRPAYTSQLDYEGELAVVIGRRASGVAPERAMEHVFGYAIMDDVTARDRQRDEPQWVRAKGGDTFAPFGPWITTADEVPDPQDLRVRTWVNGEARQDASTAGMIFGVAELVAWASAAATLEPGDVITTGTPAGVGAARRPPAFLEPGDVVRVEIGGLGAIEHAVR